ncbi:MAG: hypothetical protein ACK414_10980 [Gemmobacter sp.]
MAEGLTGPDACAPRDLAARIESAGVAKAALPVVPLVTPGNVLGGAGGVALAYRLAYSAARQPETTEESRQ